MPSLRWNVSSSVLPYTLDPSMKLVIWFIWSLGPRLQSLDVAGLERTNSMQVTPCWK